MIPHIGRNLGLTLYSKAAIRLNSNNSWFSSRFANLIASYWSNVSRDDLSVTWSSSSINKSLYASLTTEMLSFWVPTRYGLTRGRWSSACRILTTRPWSRRGVRAARRSGRRLGWTIISYPQDYCIWPANYSSLDVRGRMKLPCRQSPCWPPSQRPS